MQKPGEMKCAFYGFSCSSLALSSFVDVSKLKSKMSSCVVNGINFILQNTCGV